MVSGKKIFSENILIGNLFVFSHVADMFDLNFLIFHIIFNVISKKVYAQFPLQRRVYCQTASSFQSLPLLLRVV